MYWMVKNNRLAIGKPEMSLTYTAEIEVPFSSVLGGIAGNIKSGNAQHSASQAECPKSLDETPHIPPAV